VEQLGVNGRVERRSQVADGLEGDGRIADDALELAPEGDGVLAGQ